jgi:hypothetical protein
MTPPAHTRPGFTEELVPRFIAKLKAAYATLDQVAKLDDVGGAVLAYLESQQLPKRLLASPALQSLPWPAGIEVGFGATRGEDPVSVTPCFAAVAETGSLVLLSGPESPTTLNFLPDDHIIIVQTHQIVPISRMSGPGFTNDPRVYHARSISSLARRVQLMSSRRFSSALTVPGACTSYWWRRNVPPA